MPMSVTVGTKIKSGFFGVVTVLAMLALVATLGIGDILEKAKEVNQGNALNHVIAKREIDHLN